MNKRFTVEESNLISIFMEEGIDSDVGGRKNVINGINKTLKHLEDDEMVELSLCVLAKLKELSLLICLITETVVGLFIFSVKLTAFL